MKVLLVTLWGNINIGNRLQHYALQNALEKLDCKVDNAVYIREREHKILTFIKDCIKTTLSIIGVEKFNEYNFKSFRANKNRKSRFDEFIVKTVKNQVKIDFDDIESGALKSLVEKYSFAVTGSDQVWHHWFSKEKNELPYFYLSFFDKCKRISYAASFGFSIFPEIDKDVHKKGLEEMEHLSVRELEMVSMIETLTGRKAEVVVDPTMLLTKKEWSEVETKPRDFNIGKYVVAYFVGNKPDEYRSAIKSYVEELQHGINEDIKIVNLYDINYPEYYAISPDEFLYLIDKSEFVFTDSFHGTVFSLLYEKNFVVFRRKQYGSEDMFGRLSGLLKQMGVTGHEYNKEMVYVPALPDYDEVNRRIDVLRNKSMDWLKKSLSNEVLG